MREIKFRAWDGRISAMQDDNCARLWLQNGYDRMESTKDVIVFMQYTGLKDRHGIDIYEHDIVKILYTDWPSQLDSYPELSHEEYLDSLTYKEIVVWDGYGFWLVDKIGGYPQSIHPGQWPRRSAKSWA